MNTPVELERCFSFINCQLQPPDKSAAPGESIVPMRAITISRQSGCGAHAVAEKVAHYLEARAPATAPAWTIFDRNLVEQVLEDHKMPARLARFMTEDRVRQMDDIMDDVFGLHPPSWTFVEQTSETILRLAKLGNVIILGRGANIVTASLPHILHIRIVGSLEHRIEQMQQFEGLDRATAAERIQREDLGRQRYLKKHFGHDIDDPHLYHLIINTDWVSLDQAARFIGELALARAPRPVRAG